MAKHTAEIQVRYSSGAYNTNRVKGQTASSTMSAQAAAERLACKLFGAKLLRVEQHGAAQEDLRTTWRVFLKEA